ASRERAEEASKEAQQRKAYEELQTQEQASRERKQAIVTGILDRAISAFQVGEYEESENLAKEALDKDPRNEQAKELRDASFRAGRTKVREEYVQHKREQFRRWQESMKEVQVP